MARLFDDAASQCLQVNTAVATAPPLSMACWFNTDDLTVVGTLMALQIQSGPACEAGFRLRVVGTVANDPIGTGTVSGACAGDEARHIGTTANTWHHAAGVWRLGILERWAYLDGVGTWKQVNIATAAVNCMMIGATRLSGAITNPFSGLIAEAAVWNTDLTQAEITLLANGWRPCFVRPENIVAYWPLVRDSDIDVWGGYTMTPINGPTVGPHCPIIYGVPLGLHGPVGGPGPVPTGVGLSSLSGLSGLSAIIQ